LKFCSGFTIKLEKSGLIAAAETPLKQTALNATHRALGAKMVDYCGWDMPVEYSGITREHLAVRTAAGLFDVSHMGEIEVRGPQALALVQHITSNDASRLQDGQAQYSALMLPGGSCIDDCVVHRFAAEHYFICVNAANTDRDYAWMVQCNSFGADVLNVSAQYAQIALQGPRALEILSKVTDKNPADLKYYWFRKASCTGVDGILARTGYTGEDGFEFYYPPAASEHVWNALLNAGQGGRVDPRGPRRPQHAASRSRVCALRPRTRRQTPRCWKPIWAGSPSLRRANSWAATYCSGNKPRARRKN
jgi:aminomethyltransferase